MKSLLWPHNENAGDIDISYYENLPKVSYVEGQEPFIWMFPLSVPLDWTPYKAEPKSIIRLVAPNISSDEEAVHFAKAIEKHCYGIVKVVGNLVYASFHVYSISANWREKEKGFKFANWS